jgi:hypothetical protein
MEVGRKQIDDARNQVISNAAVSGELTGLADKVHNFDKRFYGPARAGTNLTNPFGYIGLGPKSVNVGGNTWDELNANIQDATPEEKKLVGQYQDIRQDFGRSFQELRHKLTGAVFTDRESQGYAQQLTGFSDNPFEGDPELLEAALRRAAAHADKRTMIFQRLAQSGYVDPSWFKMTNAELEQTAGSQINSGGGGASAGGAQLSDDDIINALGDY